MVCFILMGLVSVLYLLIRSLIASTTALAAENPALRQQLAVEEKRWDNLKICPTGEFANSIH